MDLNLEGTCRVCLSNLAVHNIFVSKRKHADKKVTYCEMMNTLFCMSVRQDDGLPPKICSKCYTAISSNYKFRNLALKSFRTLLEHFSTCDVKDSDINEEIDIEYKLEDIKDEAIDESHDSTAIEATLSSKCDESVDYNALSSNNFTQCSVVIEKKEFDDNYEFPDFANFDDDCEDANEEPLVLEDLKIEEGVIKTQSTLKRKKLKNGSLSVKKKRKSRAKEKPAIKQPVDKTQALSICDVCGKLVVGLKEHREMHKEFEARKKYFCGDCPKIFLSYGARSRHRKNIHTNVKYYCDICQKHYKNERIHIKMKHSGIIEEKRFDCSMCEKKFARKSLLAHHMLLHTDEKPAECPDCGKRFRSKSICNSHRKEVHERLKRHMCQYCSKGFYVPNRLRVHMLTHSNERNYKCDMCDQMCKNQRTLRMHKLLHTGTRNVKCELCDNKFYTKGRLRTHIISAHTTVKKHPCKYCGVMFRRTEHRNRHEKTAHENKMDKSSD